jgi:hypothetical protein
MRVVAAAAIVFVCAAGASLPAAQGRASPTSPLAQALPEGYTGKDICIAACATCHGLDGKGSPQSLVGFDTPLPDFTDCSFATPEPMGDWIAVIHDGGPIRLLPRGFDKATANADIAVRGHAVDDGTFTGGGDRVRYVVPLAQAQGPFAIEVELRYQPIGFRWAQNLVRYDSPEPRRFVGYFNSMARVVRGTRAHIRSNSPALSERSESKG